MRRKWFSSLRYQILLSSSFFLALTIGGCKKSANIGYLKDDGSILEEWLCDHANDCAQCDDESSAQCFIYDDENSQKYLIAERCDGYKDCSSGWDEEYC